MIASPELRRCRLCASERSEPALAEVPLLRRCLDCRLVWRAVPLEQPVANVYDDGYFGEDGPYPSYFARASQWRYEAGLRLRWLRAAIAPRRLLEIGCGGGFFLELVCRAGIEVQGVELSPIAAAYARERLGLPVTQGAFEEVELAGGFDAVCAFHVLEHAVDPAPFLDKAQSLLVPGGWLALEVPNIESARARREGADWVDLVPDYHLWHFNPQTLVRLLEGAGFTAVRCDTVFARHYFPPSARRRRPGLAHLFHDWRSVRSPRSVHCSAGDIIRVLARRDA